MTQPSSYCETSRKFPLAREQRKLAAILAADVSYSRLMGAVERHASEFSVDGHPACAVNCEQNFGRSPIALCSPRAVARLAYYAYAFVAV